MFKVTFTFVILCLNTNCFAGSKCQHTRQSNTREFPLYRSEKFGQIPTDTTKISLETLSYKILSSLTSCSFHSNVVIKVKYKNRTFLIIDDEYVKGTPKDGSDNFGYDSQFISYFDFSERSYFTIHQIDLSSRYQTDDFITEWKNKRYRNPNYLDSDHATIFTNKEYLSDINFKYFNHIKAFSFYHLDDDLVNRYHDHFQSKKDPKFQPWIGSVLDSMLNK